MIEISDINHQDMKQTTLKKIHKSTVYVHSQKFEATALFDCGIQCKIEPPTTVKEHGKFPNVNTA